MALTVIGFPCSLNSNPFNVDDWAVSAQAFSGLRIQVSRQRKVPGHSFEADAQFDVPETVSSELPLPLPQNLIIRYSGAAALELYGRFAATVVSAGEPIGSVHIHGIEAVELRGSCL